MIFCADVIPSETPALDSRAKLGTSFIVASEPHFFWGPDGECSGVAFQFLSDDDLGTALDLAAEILGVCGIKVASMKVWPGEWLDEPNEKE